MARNLCEHKDVLQMESSTSFPRKTVAPKEGTDEAVPKAAATGPALSALEMVSQLEELVRLALECENKELRDGVSFADVYNRLIGIRKSLDFLAADQEKLLSFLRKVDAKRAARSSQGPEGPEEGLEPKDNPLLEKLKQLKASCEQARERVHASLSQHPGAAEEIKEKIASASFSKKKKIIHRKGKFRQIGETGGWMRT